MNRSYIRQIRRSSSNVDRPYLYRKEVSLRPDSNTPPSLTVTQRLKVKENLIFGGAPNFNQLKSDDRGGKNKNGTMSLEEMKEFMSQQQQREKNKKNYKKEAPSNEKIREHLRTIVKYHKKEVEELMPTAYPLLGPAGKSEDDEEGQGQAKGTASADVTIRSNKETSGRKKRLPSANERSNIPPKKRGKKK